MPTISTFKISWMTSLFEINSYHMRWTIEGNTFGSWFVMPLTKILELPSITDLSLHYLRDNGNTSFSRSLMRLRHHVRSPIYLYRLVCIHKRCWALIKLIITHSTLGSILKHMWKHTLHRFFGYICSKVNTTPQCPLSSWLKQITLCLSHFIIKKASIHDLKWLWNVDVRSPQDPDKQDSWTPPYMMGGKSFGFVSQNPIERGTRVYPSIMSTTKTCHHKCFQNHACKVVCGKRTGRIMEEEIKK